MNRVWHLFSYPLLKAYKPEHIVEIGLDNGQNTINILACCEQYNCQYTGVDPVDNIFPQIKKHPLFSLLEKTSHDALPLLRDADCFFLNGDHNYYTVYNELRLIAENLTKDALFPLIFFHKLTAPYGRRDFYYNLDAVPEEGRAKELEECPGGYYRATHEGGPKNGILTAVEDFVQESSFEFVWQNHFAYNGYGVLADKRHAENIPAIKDFLWGHLSSTVPEKRFGSAHFYNLSPVPKYCRAPEHDRHRELTELAGRASVLICSAGGVSTVEVSLRRFRYHSPETLDILVAHSGEGAQDIAQLCEKYAVRFLRVAEEQIAHGEALDKGIRHLERDFFMTCDSDAFPIDNNWLEVFFGPLAREEAVLVGPGVYTVAVYNDRQEAETFNIPHVCACAGLLRIHRQLSISFTTTRLPGHVQRGFTDPCPVPGMVEIDTGVLFAMEVLKKYPVQFLQMEKILGISQKFENVFFHILSTTALAREKEEKDIHCEQYNYLINPQNHISKVFYSRLLTEEYLFFSGIGHDMFAPYVREHTPFNIEITNFGGNAHTYQSLLALKGKKLAVWGVGGRFQGEYLNFLRNLQENFSALILVDSNKEKQQEVFMGLPVSSPEEIMHASIDTVLICSAFRSGIRTQLQDMGYKGQILTT